MRIAVTHPVFWPEVRRGAERLAWELAHGLAERGHSTRIVTTHVGRSRSGMEDGVPVHRAPRPPLVEDRLRRRGYDPFLSCLPGTYAALRSARDDVAVALQPGDAVAAARAGVPHVFAYMGIPHRRALVGRRLAVELLVRAARGATAVTALSAHARDAFAHWFGIEAKVVHPPVDLETFRPGLASRSEHPTAVFAGDPREPRKRFGLLAAAWPLVRREHPHAELLVDDAGVALPEGARAVRLDDRDALARTYASAWCSVLPSWGEAFGLVLAEALACGTPVVGARLGGIPEVLGDAPVGALFDGDEPRAVADAILEAFELAPGDACRARAETFARDRCAAAYERLCLHAVR